MLRSKEAVDRLQSTQQHLRVVCIQHATVSHLCSMPPCMSLFNQHNSTLMLSCTGNTETTSTAPNIPHPSCHLQLLWHDTHVGHCFEVKEPASQMPPLSRRSQHLYPMLTDTRHAQVFPPPGPARQMQWRRCSRACRSGMGRTTTPMRCAPGVRSCCGTPASTKAKRVDPPIMAAGQSMREILDLTVILLATGQRPAHLHFTSIVRSADDCCDSLTHAHHSTHRCKALPMGCQLKHQKNIFVSCFAGIAGDPGRCTLLSFNIAV